ncbi:hypothetical protein QE410_000097 [Microbacterium sp. SORGH_AS 1204]|uniref:hypothetical protein n=1 Tax=Microbacterium sp. SORGH_AS_1204 TaxID=3041785 RepID=UPI002794EFB1|nr:hypothetical protein [Microbacterium sp. SORGH_AS_1204]MDQ1135298.1 hypothetical protein [Microbacterium sp. SORGH_AS_1204]
MARHEAPPQIAVWLLIGATFALSSSVLFGLDGLWRWNLTVLGFLLIVVGMVRLTVEIRGRGGAAAPDDRDQL